MALCQLPLCDQWPVLELVNQPLASGLGPVLRAEVCANHGLIRKWLIAAASETTAERNASRIAAVESFNNRSLADGSG
jgi:hypothetical protein